MHVAARFGMCTSATLASRMPRCLVWQAATRTMNPTVPQSVIDRAMERDPASASAEYLAQFRSDLESYVARDVVDAAVVAGRYELPPASGISYAAFVDPSGGSADSMTLAIAHRNNDGGLVLDAVRERKPPFSPDDVVLEFAALLKTYRVRTVSGDRYGGEWPRERFRIVGLTYELSKRRSPTFTGTCYRSSTPARSSFSITPGLSRSYVVWSVALLEAVEIPSTMRPDSMMTSPMLLPEQCLRRMLNAGFSSLAMKCWHGPHDRGSIHGHRHTETDHLRHTDGNHRRARGAIE